MDADLELLVAAALDESSTPGCAVAVAHDGRTWTRGFGVANAETGLPFTPSTRIPICSMTKPYTATLVMSLVEEGRIELDAPVREYLPRFRVADPQASAEVTVRQLLDHTAGWVGDLEDENRDQFDRGDTAVAEQVERMATLAQVTPPGKVWSYSNSAYVVAGRIAEAVSGATYESLVWRVVLEPLGLTQTTLFPELAITHPIAVGHEADDDGFTVIEWPWCPERRISPAGAIISTAVDQLRWVRWWLGERPEGVVAGPVASATRERVLAETVPGGNICDAMGIGWMIDHMDGARVVHHGGTGFGLQTLGLFVPEAALALVVLANARGGLLVQKRIRERVLEQYAGLRAPARQPFEIDPARLAEYVARYRQPGTDGVALDVRLADDLVSVLLPPEDPSELPARVDTRAVRDDELVLVDGPMQGMRAEFLRDGDGPPYAFRFGGRLWLREPAAGR